MATAAPRARSLFQNYRDRQTKQPHLDGISQIMREVTRKFLEDMETDSVFFQQTPPRQIAHLEPNELQLDKSIGMGEFGVVLEVASISLSNNECNNPSTVTPTRTVISKDDHQHSLKLIRNQPHQALRQPRHHSMSTGCGSCTSQSWTVGLKSSEEVNWDKDYPNRVANKSLLTTDKPTHLRPRNGNKHVLRLNISNTVLRHDDAPSPDSAVDDEAYLPWALPRNRFARDLQPSKCRRRYAVKQIRPDLYPKKKVEAAKDLAREAQLLSRLQHPNIVPLWATVGSPGEASFMLLMDRLEISLSDELSQWHQQLNDATSGGLVFPWQVASFSTQRKELERTILTQRLLALYDVVQAMQYLHKNSILLRDLKTENVARNYRGIFQLLDFGLAKEVKAKDRVIVTNTFNDSTTQVVTHPSDYVYKMTALTGTVRIMSPEVLQCQPYGLPSDVYSFGILLWEVFRGDKNRLSAAEIAKGVRPELPVTGMPQRVESLVKKCFSTPGSRPTFEMLCQEVLYQLLEHQGDEPAATHYIPDVQQIIA